MRALVVAPQPFFTPRGTPFSVYYRTLVTAELGVEVDLLTYGDGQDVDIPHVRIIRIPRFRMLGPIPVGPSRIKAFLDVFIVLWMLGLLLRNRYDLVHAHEEAVFPCVLLKRIFGFRLLYDMHSSLPQQLANFRFTTSRPLIGLFEALERTSLRTADAIITVCPALADYARRELTDPGKHFLIENSIFDPIRFRDARPQAGAGPTSSPAEIPQNVPLIVYAGTLEPYQGIDLLLEAFSRIIEGRRKAFLLVIGGTPEQVDRYAGMARTLGVASATLFAGRLPPDAARAWSAKADVLVSPRIAGTNTPLKIYEQLASGIPLVATRVDSHTQVLDDRVAFLADPEPGPLAESLISAIEDRGERKRRVDAARRLYETNYSRAAYVSKLAQVLEKLA